MRVRETESVLMYCALGPWLAQPILRRHLQLAVSPIVSEDVGLKGTTGTKMPDAQKLGCVRVAALGA